MPAPHPVEIKLEGRTHRGDWTLEQGCKLKVRGYYYGSKIVDLGEAATTKRAQEVLLELVQAWMAEREAPKDPRPAGPIDKPLPFAVLVDRRPYNGTWRMLGAQVFVYSAYGSRAAPVKRSTPERVAERLLKELVREWRDGDHA